MHPLRSTPLFVAILFFGATDFTAAEDQPPYGFSQADAPAQLALEQRFDAALDAQQIGAWLQQLSSERESRRRAAQQGERGISAAAVQGLGLAGRDRNVRRAVSDAEAALRSNSSRRTTSPQNCSEPPIDGDRTSQRTDGLPPYNVYGADGDVTGRLVYVNQGMADDYKELARRGIDVKGKIVITRYGGGWRGIKPKLAYEHGAIGCLIYSDPKTTATRWATRTRTVVGVRPTACSAARCSI